MDGQRVLFPHPEENPSEAGVSLDMRRKFYRFGKPVTANEMLSAAKLNWEVEVQQVYRGNNKTPIQGEIALARTDTNEMLGKATDKYTIIQNQTVASLFQLVLADNYESSCAGVTDKGRLWLAADSMFPDAVTCAEDSTVVRIVVSWRHDGKTAVNFTAFLFHRQMQSALATIGQFSITHTQDVRETWQQLREFLEQVHRVQEKYVSTAKVVATHKLVDLMHLSSAAWPLKLGYSSHEAEERAEEQRLALAQEVKIFHDTGKHTEPGTFWAAFLGICHVVDNIEGDKKNRNYVDYSWYGDGMAAKERAFKYLLRYRKPESSKV